MCLLRHQRSKNSHSSFTSHHFPRSRQLTGVPIGCLFTIAQLLKELPDRVVPIISSALLPGLLTDLGNYSLRHTFLCRSEQQNPT
jgi:hypothetical protein